MKKVTRGDLILLAVILVGFSVFVVPRIVFQSKPAKLDWSKKAGKVYYCPMHPTYTSDRPGDCPICNMKLVLRPDVEGAMETGGSHVEGHAAVHITAEKQQLMGVKLGKVEKRKLVKEIRTTGRVAFDPDLFTAQQEYLSAVKALEKAKSGPYHEPLERTRALVESIQIRLRLLGMSEEEIAELGRRAAQDRNLILPPGAPKNPQSTPEQFVWVYGTVYEYETPFVKAGTPVRVRVPTFSDREFTGEVVALDPVLDSRTRSIRLRSRVRDPEGLLRPEMYVDLYLQTDVGEALAVPEAAVVFTGERAIVFVTQGEGHFEPREVKVGAKAGGFYEVLSGVEVGEKITVSGNFLIDSESRLQSALEGMAGGGHPHGQ